MIDFEKAYFIKLGTAGDWEERAITGGFLRLGFGNPYHEQCLSRDYSNLKSFFENEGKKKAVVTSTINQISNFYEANESILWVTFYNKKLWWGFATGAAKLLECGSRTREIKDGWKCTDSNGKELTIDRLSGKLTKVQMYRGTICNIKEHAYLGRKLNAVVLPEVEKAQLAEDNLIAAVMPLIKNLSWQDFELLVDLLFANAGWRRIGILGKTEKDIDIDLLMPINGKRAFVQIKSSSSQEELDEYIEKFESIGIYSEMYYITHTTSKNLVVSPANKDVKIINCSDLCKLVINAGMSSWLIKKAA